VARGFARRVPELPCFVKDGRPLGSNARYLAARWQELPLLPNNHLEPTEVLDDEKTHAPRSSRRRLSGHTGGLGLRAERAVAEGITGRRSVSAGT
jgi:hypothetical protein